MCERADFAPEEPPLNDQPENLPSDADPIEAARERYKREREKRLRSDGLAQYSQLAEDYEEYDHDPWVEPGFTRAA